MGLAGRGEWQAEQPAPSPDPGPSSQTCVIRAWDLRKPLLFCPAMNTAMWEHPITSQQVGQLKGFGYVEIPCVAKKLVCGDQGGHLVRLIVCPRPRLTSGFRPAFGDLTKTILLRAQLLIWEIDVPVPPLRAVRIK